MSQTIANIAWTPVPGSTSTLVEYKLSTDVNWTTPPSPANPTIFAYYPLTITDGFVYDVRLTTNGATCGSSSRTFQIISQGGNSCCPVDYTLAPDGSYCYKYVDIGATPPATVQNTVAVNHLDYSAWGTLIYDPGYNINGTGTFTQISYSNSFWVNGAGFPSGGGITTTAGPLNRTGVWVAIPADNQSIGYSVCVHAPVAGTYYVGTAGDNYSTINVDGTNVVIMDPVAMAAYLNAHGYGGLSIEVAFRFWHIYPIFLTAGDHIIEIIGLNITGPASIGAEVYFATPTELQAAASYADLGSKLLFSSKDYIGQPVQIGTGGTGYTCPPGYALVLCEGAPFCRQILTQPTQPCGNNLVYWGVNLTGLTPDEAGILAGNVEAADVLLDVPVDFRPFNASPRFCWVAIPDVSAEAHKNNWYIDDTNQGAIGGLTNLFGDPVTVLVSGDPYLVWITNYQTQFVQLLLLRKV